MTPVLRLGMSLALAWGCCGVLLAQEPPVIVEHQGMVEAAPAPRGIRLAAWPLGQRSDPSLREKINQRGYCCDSHIDWYGCGGFRAQMQFVFGSCRTFFSEPCLPKPPHGQRHHGQGGPCSNCR